MKNLISFITCLSFLSTAWAGLGEKNSQSYQQAEYIVKSFIEAHRKDLARRVNRYNDEGLDWVIKEVENKNDSDLIKTQIKRTRIKKLHPIRVRDNTYVMKVSDYTFSFSNSDILMDRIFINGNVFKLSKKESLSQFQDRLYNFITDPDLNKKTSFVDLFISKAHASPVDKSLAHEMVILNATGVVSISYEEPWFWEVGEYASGLASALTDELDTAYSECKEKSSQLSQFNHRRMGGHMREIINSMKENGEITEARLISSLLKKYSVRNNVDRESSSHQGSYKPIGGDCKSMDKSNPGLVMQMFPVSDYAPVLTGQGYSDWVNNEHVEAHGKLYSRYGICSALKKTVACLENLETIHERNVNNSLEEIYIERSVDFDSGTVYDTVSGTHGK